MKNIPILVHIEGQDSKVNTDWLAIMATLKKRGLERDELEVVYFELCAGMRVTTRGLGLAKVTPVEPLQGLLYEPKFSARDYAGMLIA
ncbi:hypothetical protein L2719_01095 [Shewanella schlegeliana]|uniref:Uncharacterized protein n=1 Tax=Shewanella schlegeliana TaxID=190308 RepID=A0ABS1SV05_9GAMM|nr:hypothetical protein [Shewanella schlegeliana]MBL4912371.1 hypothetical protein [Shewanella schlegeliana]MCL1108159.1 hypothetical protein [Shewanella schlegeliana]GIU22017.1 hypothetical protein TUM4433_02180 [Shewanella schlegeliana]